jgi:hypothetical protein
MELARPRSSPGRRCGVPAGVQIDGGEDGGRRLSATVDARGEDFAIEGADGPDYSSQLAARELA